MSEVANVMFVGGPGSGKSNYLFRLWLAIEHENGRLRKDGLPAELDYLHDGASRLLSGAFAPHTSIDAPATCEIPIAFKDSGESALLTVPDVSGEVWDAVYEKREWPIAWDAHLARGCGITLFVRASHHAKPLDWLTCERLYRTRGERAETRVPTQVMIVDWLQNLYLLLSSVTRSPRLSVVVTAWDSVKDRDAPFEYLQSELPLLAQFLMAGLHGFDARIFGLSIAGGNFDDPAFRAEFLAGVPSKQGYCVAQKGREAERSTDVLLPLYWALGR